MNIWRVRAPLLRAAMVEVECYYGLVSGVTITGRDTDGRLTTMYICNADVHAIAELLKLGQQASRDGKVLVGSLHVQSKDEADITDEDLGLQVIEPQSDGRPF